MDLDRLNTGEKIAAVSAILLFIFMFFDWFGVEVSGAGGFSGSRSRCGRQRLGRPRLHPDRPDASRSSQRWSALALRLSDSRLRAACFPQRRRRRPRRTLGAADPLPDHRPARALAASAASPSTARSNSASSSGSSLPPGSPTAATAGCRKRARRSAAPRIASPAPARPRRRRRHRAGLLLLLLLLLLAAPAPAPAPRQRRLSVTRVGRRCRSTRGPPAWRRRSRSSSG